MASKRTYRRSAQQVQRDLEVRARFQGTKPSLQDLVDGGEFTEPVKQGECLAAMGLASRRKKLPGSP